MQHSRARIVIDGAVAGIVGAVVVALWFLIFDTIRGHPFETPALLAATILHGSHSVEVHHALILLSLEYSLIHFAAFIAFGIAGGLLLETCETESALLFSLAIFFAAFEVFFIAVVLFLGPDVMAELTWWGIIVGNLLATTAMLSYFFWRHPSLAWNLLGGWLSVAREGITAGLIGAITVAVWFMIYDFAAGEPFHTPALLGAMIFQNITLIGAIKATLPLVLGYTILHFFAFEMFGVALAILLAASEWEPFMALGVMLSFAGLVTSVVVGVVGGVVEGGELVVDPGRILGRPRDRQLHLVGAAVSVLAGEGVPVDLAPGEPGQAGNRAETGQGGAPGLLAGEQQGRVGLADQRRQLAGSGQQYGALRTRGGGQHVPGVLDQRLDLR